MFHVNVKGLLFTCTESACAHGERWDNHPDQFHCRLPFSASRGLPALSIYSAAKAVRNFVRTWTTDLKDRGIHVHVISPGPIDTSLLKEAFSNPGDMKALAPTVVMGRRHRSFGRPSWPS